VQREAVFGECRRGPELASGGDRVACTVSHPEQARPVPLAGSIVDQPYEPVEIGAVDQVVERVVVDPHGQTSGQG